MFRRAKNTTVFGGTFTEVHEGLNGRQILSQSPHVVHGAIHDSGQRYPPSVCHPGTREDILNIALGWVDKPLDESESQVFWLSGPAGVGKTAIAQSLCQRLQELGRLGGDFFLSRSITGHTDLHTLFPTLAYQLAQAYPEFGIDLDNVINSDESILRKNMELQLTHLIVNPLNRVTNNLNTPFVFVIDGLDEAGGERDQISFLQLLSSGLLSHRHLPLKIILTSRPEPWIKTAFGDSPLLGSARSHFLHRTSQTDKDIRIFLQSKFEEIQIKHDLMQSQSDRWPSHEGIDNIIDRASGQFIYASTVLRYVEDPNGNPVERLEWILKMTSIGRQESNDSPFLALDNLYKHVLSTSSNIHHTLTILGAAISYGRKDSFGHFLLALNRRLDPANSSDPELNSNSSRRSSLRFFQPGQTRPAPYSSMTPDTNFSIDRIERILNFRVNDGFLAVRTIQSLVDISACNGKRDVKFYHKSFQDFLLDGNRSGEYFLDMNRVHSELMQGALRLIKAFEQCDTIQYRKQIYQDLGIIEQEWVKWWLRSAASDENRLLTDIKAIDKAAFYRNYTSNIARKVPFLLSKTRTYPTRLALLVESHLSSGNIAELMSWEIERRTVLSLSLERFQALESVFDKHIRQALRTKFIVAVLSTRTGTSTSTSTSTSGPVWPETNWNHEWWQ